MNWDIRLILIIYTQAFKFITFYFYLSLNCFDREKTNKKLKINDFCGKVSETKNEDYYVLFNCQCVIYVCNYCCLRRIALQEQTYKNGIYLLFSLHNIQNKRY